MKNLKLFAGFDGGGTKTACVLCDEAGTILGHGFGGPSNYLYCGREAAFQSVKMAQEQAFHDAGLTVQKLCTAYMASAAIRLGNGEAHAPFFRGCIDAESLICESDIYPIWYGTVGEKPAVVSIVGTGYITYICRKDVFIRVGGWGPLLGDEGSGYDIGLHALRLAARIRDGRCPKDEAFFDAVLCHLDLQDAFDMIRAVNSGDARKKIAGVARVVVALADAGNASAIQILQNAAEEIALSIGSACEQDAKTDRLPVVLSGGLMQEDRMLFKLVRGRIPAYTNRICEVKAAAVSPAASAAALALHSRGLEAAARKVLAQSGGERA